MKNLKTIILAAGQGTRMKSDIPKVLHPVAGRPMIQYVVDVARQIGSLKVYVVLGHQEKVVRRVLGKGLVIVVQKKLSGTAAAVKTTGAQLSSFAGDVLILCGDAPLVKVETVKKLIEQHRDSRAACTVLTTHVSVPQGYGRMIRDSGGNVVAIREEKDASLEEREITEINTGVYCFKARELFGGLKSVRLNLKKKEFYLTDIVDLLVKKGLGVCAVRTDDPREGLGINDREDLSVAENLMRRRILKKFMENGVGIVDPQNTYVAADAKIGRDTTIKPFTVIENNVTIGKNCSIGPFARLRPGTKIANGVEIGNFTEVSRTMIGERTLMKHFSFLGDTVVGSYVNIGAGVVTANYDGKDKNKTIIKDEAFIGSDSVLVAPLTVGKKAITGAGSVVTKGKNVPDGGIAVGVPARILRRKRG